MITILNGDREGENNQQVFIKNPIMHILKLVFSILLYKKSASHSCSHYVLGYWRSLHGGSSLLCLLLFLGFLDVGEDSAIVFLSLKNKNEHYISQYTIMNNGLIRNNPFAICLKVYLITVVWMKSSQVRVWVTYSWYDYYFTWDIFKEHIRSFHSHVRDH